MRVAMLPSLDLELDDDVTSDDVFVDPCALSDRAWVPAANDADDTQPAPTQRITLPGPPPEPPTVPALPVDRAAQLVRGGDALSSQEAKVIVSGSSDAGVQHEAELRARLHAEVLELVRAAIASTPPPRPAQDAPSLGAAVRWMLAGAVLGAMVVYVLMASALHHDELLLARASTPPTVFVPQAAPPSMTKAAPLVCPASPADVIPSVDVNALPKTKPPARVLRRGAPAHGAPAPAVTSSTNVDEANPYDGVSADGATAEPTL
jgi:hypothetical protein